MPTAPKSRCKLPSANGTWLQMKNLTERAEHYQHLICCINNVVPDSRYDRLSVGRLMIGKTKQARKHLREVCVCESSTSLLACRLGSVKSPSVWYHFRSVFSKRSKWIQAFFDCFWGIPTAVLLHSLSGSWYVVALWITIVFVTAQLSHLTDNSCLFFFLLLLLWSRLTVNEKASV